MLNLKHVTMCRGPRLVRGNRPEGRESRSLQTFYIHRDKYILFISFDLQTIVFPVFFSVAFAPPAVCLTGS